MIKIDKVPALVEPTFSQKDGKVSIKALQAERLHLKLDWELVGHKLFVIGLE